MACLFVCLQSYYSFRISGLPNARQGPGLRRTQHHFHGRCCEGWDNAQDVSQVSQTVGEEGCTTNLIVLILFDSLAALLLTNVAAKISRAVRHLEPIIKERYQKLEELGDDWEDKPVRCYLIHHSIIL